MNVTIRYLADAGTVVLAVCAVVVTLLVLRREFFPPEPQVDEPRRIDTWAGLTSGGHRLGPETAHVEIVEFSDFQCPFCARVQPALNAVRERYPDEVAVIFRHFPLEAIHPHAVAAANAAECAADQRRFEPLHTLLFERQDRIGVIPFDRFAEDAAVPDIGAFKTCLEEGRHAERVRRDARLAREAGLRSTPSIIVNGWLLPGTPGSEQLLAIVDSILAIRDGAAAIDQVASP